eukprot:CAMPEP_0194288200 /NCGR_PEP_ID=MMETSP0169-20130528/36339_1 /TAXON_ID=218684 /ORGANISM="Corethron pennatum, Strain L29A3" /LENGTH=434 /DNA_ID=CAMNT_0039035131 /DNA_START=43 /DNA_END=1344 /DNA_ORIENTATION=+
MDSYPDVLLAGATPLIYIVDSVILPPTRPQAASTSASSASASVPPPKPSAGSGRGRRIHSHIFDAFLDVLTGLAFDAPGSFEDGAIQAPSSHHHPLVPSDSVLPPPSSAVSPFAVPVAVPPRGDGSVGLISWPSQSNAEGEEAPEAALSSFHRRARFVAVPGGRVGLASVGFGEDGDRKGEEEILSADWLDKHQRRRPSCILLVILLDPSLTVSELSRQETVVSDTLDSIRSRAKTAVYIQLVVLVGAVAPPVGNVAAPAASGRARAPFDTDDPSALRLVEARLSSLRNRCRMDNRTISVLHFDDGSDGSQRPARRQYDLLISPDGDGGGGARGVDPMGSHAVRNLYAAVRDASMAHYLLCARRMKRKEARLPHQQRQAPTGGDPPPASSALPTEARSAKYCAKSALFYEMRGDAERSLRYFAEAYKALEGLQS